MFRDVYVYADVNALGAFLGMWEGKGTAKDSAYSKAGPSSAQTNCNWSPNHGFLVRDQIVHGLSRNNSRVRTPKLTIEEKRWTCSGEFDDSGKKIRFRTINDFTTPTTVTYRAEYSEDGIHWTLMSEGTNTKIK